jgi:hypothetical protein
MGRAVGSSGFPDSFGSIVTGKLRSAGVRWREVATEGTRLFFSPSEEAIDGGMSRLP